MEEKILDQKEKITWLKMGDGNNRHFHGSVKELKRGSAISKLVTGNGIVFTERRELESDVIQFYSKLIGWQAKLLRGIDIERHKSGRQLIVAQHKDLIKPIQEEEIVSPRKGLGYTKAPDINGYNTIFSKATWDVVGYGDKSC